MGRTNSRKRTSDWMRIALKESPSKSSKICTRLKANSKKTKVQFPDSKKKVTIIQSLPVINTEYRKSPVKIRKCSFKCEYCIRKFSKLADYTMHMNTHLRLKPYTCKFCSREFTQPTLLKLHRCCQKRKTKLNPLPCKVCGKKIQQTTVLLHMRSHNRAKLYACSQCPKKFALKSTMYKHQMTHFSNFQCQICQKVFSMPSQLEQHMYIHMDDLAVFKCLYCPRILRDQEKYEKHINFHIHQATLKGKRNGVKTEEKIVSDNNQIPEEIVKTETFDRTRFYIKRHEEKSDELIDRFGKDVSKSSEESSVSFLIGPSKCTNKTKEFQESKDENELTIQKLECVLCKLSFNSISLFKQHVDSHGNSSGIFPSQLTKTTDVKVAVAKKIIYVCRWCSKKFISFEFAAEHVLNFAEEPDLVHRQCMEDVSSDIPADELIEKFMYKFAVGNMKSIAQDSSGFQTFVYHCSKCSTNFVNKQTLFSHIPFCNKQEPKYRCPTCNVNFQDNWLLKEHIKLGHEKILPVTDPSLDLIIASTELTKNVVDNTEKVTSVEMSCRKCDILFTSTEEFIKHRESKHNGKSQESDLSEETEYLCTHCNLAFPSQADFYKHLNVHKLIKKAPPKKEEYQDRMYQDSRSGCWVCRICDKSFSNKSNTTRHITLHDKNEKKDHPCPFCSRVFQYQRYLRHHIMYMHKSRDQNEHVCELCEMKFSSGQARKRHMRLHTGESQLLKVLKCEYCDRMCKCKEELKLHMRVHTGERPFSCHLCSYQAAVYYNLKKHIRLRHENASGPKQRLQSKSTLKDELLTNESLTDIV